MYGVGVVMFNFVRFVWHVGLSGVTPNVPNSVEVFVSCIQKI